MQHKNVKKIIQYYNDIPEMKRMLKEEREELEGLYNGLGSANTNGMPGGGGVGKPTETLAIRADAAGAWDRLREIDVRVEVLESDAATVRDCLDSLTGRYKRILLMRYQYRYSWAKISVRMEVPDSTARNWHNRAIEGMGEALDDVPMVEELLGRASRACA